MKKVTFILFASMGINFSATSQSVGDFRSIANGNWNDATKWETYNGTNWIAATTYPGQNAGAGLVEIMKATEIAITAALPNPISSLYIDADDSCSCGNNEYVQFGTVVFSAESATS